MKMTKEIKECCVFWRDVYLNKLVLTIAYILLLPVWYQIVRCEIYIQIGATCELFCFLQSAVHETVPAETVAWK